jgi:filamentous hemagglutinin
LTNQLVPITGIAPSPGFAKGARVLQTGGHILKATTLKALRLTKAEGKFAIESMKKANGLRNDFHGIIMSNGDVLDDLGRLIDNLLEYLH